MLCSAGMLLQCELYDYYDGNHGGADFVYVIVWLWFPWLAALVVCRRIALSNIT